MPTIYDRLLCQTRIFVDFFLFSVDNDKKMTGDCLPSVDISVHKVMEVLVFQWHKGV